MPNLRKQQRLKFVEGLLEAIRQLVIAHEMKIKNLNERLEKLEPKKEESCPSKIESEEKPS